MCGIAGYIGRKNAPEILFDMLKRLEYRGYDSAGLAYFSNGEIKVVKDKGKVDDVRAKVKPETLSSNVGVAHTRWATHGRPIQVNAHPHEDCTGRFVVAHNGIIENYAELKKDLELNGHKFKSDTDTEVLAHLIEDYYEWNKDFFTAFQRILDRLEGSYAITAMSRDEPDRILVARNESPLIIGLGDGENFIASDVPAFLPYTNRTIILDDGEFAVVTSASYPNVYKMGSGKKIIKVEKKEDTVAWSVEEAEKGGFRHFMLKEIMEEPNAARNALRSEKELKVISEKLAKKKRIIFVACGTAYHSGLVGKYVMEIYGIPAEAMVASEFRYSTVNSLDDESAVVAISQSGETADTLAAVKEARKKGAYVASIVNVVGSTITRYSDDVAYTHSGPEIAVASTKAYTGQVVSAVYLALHTSKIRKKISDREYKKLIYELKDVPAKIKEILDGNNVKELSEKYVRAHTFFYIGRRQDYPTALEGALKLKEISYVHAEGYPSGELKHGPLALLEEGVVVIAISPEDELKDKLKSNISEVKARGASVIEVGSKGAIKIPPSSPVISPILSIVPLHLFAYYLSDLKGIDPDKPRNLAKSVTVE